MLCGWVCEAEDIKFIIDDLPPQEVGYGTERLDTEEECGDTDNGFGLLVNWNRFGDGEHTVRALADGVELGRATFTVTTLGEEFVRGVTGETIAMDFPGEGEDVRLVWQQSLQNFMIAPFGGEPMTSPQEANDWPLGILENPGPSSFQSGLGVISGWRCEAKTVEIIIDEMAPQRAAYGTERLDTAEVCGDTDNGFGLLVNWNRFGDGEHTLAGLGRRGGVWPSHLYGDDLGRRVCAGGDGGSRSHGLFRSRARCPAIVAAEFAELHDRPHGPRDGGTVTDTGGGPGSARCWRAPAGVARSPVSDFSATSGRARR